MLVIMGKSCSGKDTLIKELVSRGWKKVVNFTTRPMRDGEIEGVTYHYVSEPKFMSMVDDEDFVEHKAYDSEFGRWYYGTPKSAFNDEEKRTVVCLTPAGALDALEYASRNGLSLTLVYLTASDSVIRKRLEARGDNKKEVERRIIADKKDFELTKFLDAHEISNNDKTIIDVANEVEALFN